MYYFRYSNMNHLYIDISVKPFTNEDYKIRIEFTPKNILSIFFHDENGNLFPIKKNSDLRKKIFRDLEDGIWENFLIDGEPIEGLSNEDEEIVSPLMVLSTPKIIKKKENTFNKYFPLLLNMGLPFFDDDDVIKKHTHGEYLHIYYRKNDTIYHLCINTFENIIITYEVFSKQ